MEYFEFSPDKISNKRSKEAIIESRPQKILPDYIDFRQRNEPAMFKQDSEIAYYEKKYKLSYEEARALFQYGYDLNLKTDDLVNKKIIDIGSGDGSFKSALEKIGVDSDLIVNFDKGLDDERFRNTDVVGDVVSLPFKDESFDIAVAHCSVPIMQATSGEHGAVPNTIKEMLRVVKRGGKVKIFPIASANKTFEPQFRKDRLRMGSMVLEELDRVHKVDKDIKIKITETETSVKDKGGLIPIISWSLELTK